MTTQINSSQNPSSGNASELKLNSAPRMSTVEHVQKTKLMNSLNFKQQFGVKMQCDSDEFSDEHVETEHSAGGTKKQSMPIHKITNFNEEIMNDKNKIKTSKELFLEHLRQFAQRFLTKQKIVIERYHIDRQDIKDDIFKRLRFTDESEDQDNKKQELQVDKNVGGNLPVPSFREYLQKQVQKRAALIGTINALMQQGNENKYQFENIQILKDLIPIQDKQRMVVKTWEKMYRQAQDDNKQLYFNVKTLRIFDEFNRESAAILCEQVVGKFCSSRYYECSYILKGKNIYFFKRINRRHKNLDLPQQKNFTSAQRRHEKKLNLVKLDDTFDEVLENSNQSKSVVDGNLRDEIMNTPIDENSPTMNPAADDPYKDLAIIKRKSSHEIQYDAHSENDSSSAEDKSYESYVYSDPSDEGDDNDCEDHTYLQLYKYNISKYKQKAMEEFFIQERVSFDQNQINVMFSQPFGSITKKKYENDIEFMRSQFIVEQEYMLQNDKKKPFTICSMRNPDQKIFSMHASKRQSSIKRNQTYTYNVMEECSLISQIHQVFHTISIINNQKYLIFILITEDTHLHIKFKYPDLTLTRDHVTRFNMSQQFQRVLNPMIELQKVQLKKEDLAIIQDDKVEKMSSISAYFIVDYRNKIQLVYPNFTNNLTRVEIQKLIEQKIGFDGSENFHKFKMVWYKDFRHNEHHKEDAKPKNYVQTINHLKAVLNMPDIEEHQTLSFYRDETDQVLYITQHDSPEILQVYIKDLNCEEAYHQIEEEVLVDFKQQLQRKVLLTFNNSFISDNVEQEYIQSKKSQTRIKMMYNYYLQHQKIKKSSETYTNLWKGEDENDSIECDINSGKIIIQQKERAKFYEQHFHSGIFESIIMENQDEDESESVMERTITNKSIKNSMILQRLSSHMTQLECHQSDRKYITMKNDEGDMVQFLAYNDNFIFFEQMNLELVQQNEQFYVFVFSLVNYILGQKKKTYIFVRKPAEEVLKLMSDHYDCMSSSSEEYQAIFNRKKQHVLIEDLDKVQVLTPNCHIKYLSFVQLYSYQYGSEQSQIHLTFEKLLDVNVKINFFVMCYQESNDHTKNRLVIYDINQGNFVKKLQINPRQSNLNFMFVDHKGFNIFKIVRTSNLKYHINDLSGHKHQHSRKSDDTRFSDPTSSNYIHVIQSLKITVFTFFSQTVGRIQSQEFLIQHHNDHVDYDEVLLNPDGSPNDESLQQIYEEMYSIQVIGQKQLFLSNKCILKTDIQQLSLSQAIPFMDKFGKIQGCQFIMKHSKARKSKINLIDYSDIQGQNQNNIFQYESSLVMLGSKKFELDKIDSDDYILVIAAKLRDSVVRMRILNMEESMIVLRNMQNMYLQLRKPNFSFILKNDYNKMIANNFFSTQEILLGKSMCDICLGDPKKIGEALLAASENTSEKFEIQGTILWDILQNNETRRDYLEQMKFVPTRTIVSLDFNYNTAIYRGLMMRNLESVRLLLNYMVDYKTSSVYNDLLMLDLKYILQEKTITILDYFKESTTEKKSINRQMQAGNIEQLVNDMDVDQFSHLQMQYMYLDKRYSTNKIEQIVLDKIQERSKQQKEEWENDKWRNWKIVEKLRGDRKMYPVEHKFIDFKMMVVREKLKYLAHKDSRQSIDTDDSFDDIKDHVQQGTAEDMGVSEELISDLMMEQFHDDEFYLQESVQKIIDFQFNERTRGFMKGLLWLYIIFFIVPYFASLVIVDYKWQLFLMILCCFPQIFLLLIECIQIYDSGWDYINGWNLIDLGQLLLFWAMFVEKCIDFWYFRNEEDFNLAKFIQLLLIISSILKVVHFIAVYQAFGFFIKMLVICLHDLYPFLINYLIFLNLFAMMYVTLGVEIHEELDLKEDNHAAVNSLGYYGMLILTVYRNSVGKLGFAKYENLIESNGRNPVHLRYHIYTIWTVYFFQVLITLVIGLNFMIAIIEQTYANQHQLKEANLYRNKAELNQECAEIMKYFVAPKQIRIIIFTKFELVKSESVAMAKEIVHGKEDETEILLKKIEMELEKYIETIDKKTQVLDELDAIINKQEKYMASQDEVLHVFNGKNSILRKDIDTSLRQALSSFRDPEEEDMQENFSYNKLNSGSQLKYDGGENSARSVVSSQAEFKNTITELNLFSANKYNNFLNMSLDKRKMSQGLPRPPNRQNNFSPLRIAVDDSHRHQTTPLNKTIEYENELPTYEIVENPKKKKRKSIGSARNTPSNNNNNKRSRLQKLKGLFKRKAISTEK